MLNETLVKDGRIFFPESGIKNQNGKFLSSIMTLISKVNKNLKSETKMNSLINHLLGDLRAECEQCLSFDDIKCFGSSFNGFRNKNSDVDIVVMLKEDGIQRQLLDCKRHFDQSIKFKIKEVIRHASVPIIRVFHMDTKLECDITFSIPLIPRNDVMWNTQLLKAYSDQYPEIPDSFRMLKYILNCTEFGSARTNGLSTYGHIILFIYFVTHHWSPNLPIIDTTTFKPAGERPKKICSAQMLHDYLLYIACRLDSSTYNININQSTLVERRQNFGCLGKLNIPDPYISKNLGSYMKEWQLYNYKLFTFRLLDYLNCEYPTNLGHLIVWCKNYGNSFKDTPSPDLHPDCSKYLNLHISNYKNSILVFSILYSYKIS